MAEIIQVDFQIRSVIQAVKAKPKPKRTKTTKVEWPLADRQKSSRLTYVQGYWGYQRYRKFAWLPVFTEDFGWIWGQRYYSFWTNTGYDKHGWTWRFHGRAVSFSGITEIERRAFKSLSA